MFPIPRRDPAAAKPLRALAATLAAVLAVALAAAGCSEDGDDPVGPPPAYSSITITGPDTVVVGQTAGFTAVVLDTAGQVVAVPQLTWTSSSTAIATVNNGGAVQGQSEGDVNIRASGGGVNSNFEPLAVIQGRGWVDQSDAVNTVLDLRGVHFVSARQGWIVGATGTILHTTDAGGTWTPQVSLSTGFTLNAVAFATTATGVVVGSAGRILRTTNAGSTWSPVLGVDTDNLKGLNDVFFQDENRGWIVGNAGLILRTNNGGASWTRVLPATTTNDLHRVSFPNNPPGGSPPVDPYGLGWIVGANGTILTSGDFGQSWDIVTPTVTNNMLLGVTRHSANEAVAVGANNAALYTALNGPDLEWNLTTPTPFSNLEAVDWPGTPGSLTPAWAVGKDLAGGDPVVFRSDDGGQSWTPQVLPSSTPLINNGLLDVFFLDGRRGWAVGTQGVVLHTATGGQ